MAAPAAAATLPGSADGSTPQEQRNLGVVKEYMHIAYDPSKASAAAVRHLVADGSTFVWRPPPSHRQVKNCLQYAEDHGKLMKAVSDLHITSFDVEFAKGDWVCLRYSAEGSHCGDPHAGIPPTHKHACWTAAAIFQLTPYGKICKFYKDWDKLSMWSQLGRLQGQPLMLE